MKITVIHFGPNETVELVHIIWIVWQKETDVEKGEKEIVSDLNFC